MAVAVHATSVACRRCGLLYELSWSVRGELGISVMPDHPGQSCADAKRWLRQLGMSAEALHATELALMSAVR